MSSCIVVGGTASARVRVVADLVAATGAITLRPRDSVAVVPPFDLHPSVKPDPIFLRAGPVEKGRGGKVRRW